jgi:hypothetical protein
MPLFFLKSTQHTNALCGQNLEILVVGKVTIGFERLISVLMLITRQSHVLAVLLPFKQQTYPLNMWDCVCLSGSGRSGGRKISFLCWESNPNSSDAQCEAYTNYTVY